MFKQIDWFMVAAILGALALAMCAILGAGTAWVNFAGFTTVVALLFSIAQRIDRR